MIEDELRASFARHEPLAPDAGPLRAAIDNLAVRRRRRRFVVRAAGTALAVLATVSLPVLARTIAAGPAPAQVGGVTVTAPPTIAVSGGALNFLLLGVDGEVDHDAGSRADSVLILHVPRDRSRIYLVALPRDLGVEIPDRGFGKLNAAFFYGSRRAGGRPDLAGGAALTERTVAGLTGVSFDGTATLTFSGLRRVTDAVGGVRLCLDRPVQSIHTGRKFGAGCAQFDGAAALDLLRQRYGQPEGAHDRDRNAQRFAKALLAKASARTGTDPAKLVTMARALGDGLALDTKGLSLPDLLRAVRDVGAAEPVGIGWKIHSQQVNGETYERLDPAVSRGLFDAVRRDALAGWVAANPASVTPDGP
jgi:LCP family protein required for cell wall assembly